MMPARTPHNRQQPALADLITVEQILALGGRAYFGRGQEYFNSGAVMNLAQQGDAITAKVIGTRTYAVRLWRTGRTLGYSCPCPLGRDELFCKHCIAVALAWLHSNASGKGIDSEASAAQQALVSYLNSLSKDALISLLLEQAQAHDDLFRELLLRAAGADTGDVPLESLREEIATLTQPLHSYYGQEYYYDEYDDTAEKHARGLQQITTILSETLSKRKKISAAFLDLIEYCIHRIDGVMDISPEQDILIDVTKKLLHLHYTACGLLKPAAKNVAERLLRLELHVDTDLFFDAHSRYKRLLGTQGMEYHRTLIQNALEQQQSEKIQKPYAGKEQRRLANLARQVAQQSNDIDLLVATEKMEPITLARTISIVEIYTRARRIDDAIREAEEGIQQYGIVPGQRLADMLIQAYAKKGMQEKMLLLVWNLFMALQGIQQYQKLKQLATKAGVWPDWRKRAIDLLKADENEIVWSESARERPLITLLLADRDYETAWQEALDNDCSQQQWILLADARASTHPEDALAIYTAAIDQYSHRTTTAAYEEIVRLLKSMRKLVDRGTLEDYLDKLRERYGARKKFIAMLDEGFPRAKAQGQGGYDARFQH